MLNMRVLTSLLLLVNTLTIHQVLSDRCADSQCVQPDPNKLNVHLVAHTHDDVGWLKTVDQYYYGNKNQLSRAGVQYILDTVTRELLRNSQRKFIVVETAFFWQWWVQQSQLQKLIVKALVERGQLEFIGGGWSMNDEGTAHYNSIIDQMSWGFRRLEDEFGKCGRPTVAWQIDPFGHSKEQASLFAQMNFDAFFVTQSRIEYQESAAREQAKTLEMVWKGSDDLGIGSYIFTTIINNHYGSPAGFCYDLVRCNDDPIIDDPESEDYNVDQKVAAFADYINQMTKKYTTNQLLVPMGDDFLYQNAQTNFHNIDKLIKYVNAKPELNLNLFYSTPSCYARAVHQQNKTFTSKSDDFFPWATGPHGYIVGYFTSRPALKYYERQGNNLLQACKQLDAMSLLQKTEKMVTKMREAMGVMQHHDAVSGTETQPVADDYALKLSKGIDSCLGVMQKGLAKLVGSKIVTKSKSNVKFGDQKFCKLLNESSCEYTEIVTDKVAVTIYNPIGKTVEQKIRLPFTGALNQVFGPDGKEVISEVVPLADYVKSLPGRTSKADMDLLFDAKIPALGFATYFLSPNQQQKAQQRKQQKLKQSNDQIVVKAKTFIAYFDKSTGTLTKITLNNNKSIAMNQSFRYYKSSGSNSYAFNPDGNSVPVNDKPTYKIFIGKTYTEIQQTWSSWIGQTIRVYPDSDHLEFDWVIGPVPFQDGVNKDVVIQYTSNLNTEKTFYTDANGRQMMKRIRDHRDSFKLNVTDPISGNFYPVNSRIALQDNQQDLQLTLLTDRSQGGASLNDGQMEMMVHRRILNNGGEVGPLNETGVDGRGLVIRGKHYLIPSSVSDAPALHRDLAQRLFLAPVLSFAKMQCEIEDYRNNLVTTFSGLNQELPKNVHLLTLEQWKHGRYLVRLENFYQKSEGGTTATVELKNLFKTFKITDVTEMSLGANQEVKGRERLAFNLNENVNGFEFKKVEGRNFTVTLQPMQLRTFLVKIAV